MRSTTTLVAALALGAAACESATEPPLQDDIVVESIQFTQNSAKLGQPIGIMATVAGNSAQLVSFRAETGAGGSQEGRLLPWNNLSMEELGRLVTAANGRVFVGFKEADAARGVDMQGRNLTTPATTERMIRLLKEHGATIEWEYDLIPAVVAIIPPGATLLAMLRGHANIEYIEPIFPGEWNSTQSHPSGNKLYATVVPGSPGLPASPGDTLSVWHRRNDGTVVKATLLIRE